MSNIRGEVKPKNKAVIQSGDCVRVCESEAEGPDPIGGIP